MCVCVCTVCIIIRRNCHLSRLIFSSLFPIPHHSVSLRLPLRLKDSIQSSLSEMEGVHKEMSVDYSQGVVTGYSKKFLDASSH